MPNVLIKLVNASIRAYLAVPEDGHTPLFGRGGRAWPCGRSTLLCPRTGTLRYSAAGCGLGPEVVPRCCARGRAHSVIRPRGAGLALRSFHIAVPEDGHTPLFGRGGRAWPWGRSTLLCPRTG